MAARRDIAPLLQRFRAFLLGREHTVALRFEDGLADRTQPPPDVPGGPSHLLSDNYYYARDGRRAVLPPLDVGGQKLLEAQGQSAAESKTPPSASKLPTPGPAYQWD